MRITTPSLTAIFLSVTFLLSADVARGSEIERNIEQRIERQAQRNLDGLVERSVKRQISKDVASRVEKGMTKLVTKQVERQVSRAAIEELRNAFQIDFADRESASLDKNLRQKVTQPVQDDSNSDKSDVAAKTPVANDDISQLPVDVSPQSPDENIAAQTGRAIEQRLQRAEQQVQALQARVSTKYGIDTWTNEWVIMTDSDTKALLEREGYLFSNESYLEAFDQLVASVRAPASYDLYRDYDEIIADQYNGNLVIDYNHIYRGADNTESASITNVKDGYAPNQLMVQTSQKLTIGLVDTAVDMSHPTISSASIRQSHFLPESSSASFDHGSEIASIIVGQDESFEGVAPNSDLFVASVFFDIGESQPVATAADILKGLNYLVQNDVKVINMSLAGPPNRLMEFAINKLCEQGIYVVAAVGNAGPMAKPLFPAGYDCTVAVTAVDSKRNLYRYAIQGEHVDVASYGVDVLAASQQHQVAPKTGTSIAAPFVSVVIADELARAHSDISLPRLYQRCVDLGDTGFDSQFGYGLLLRQSGQASFASP